MGNNDNNDSRLTLWGGASLMILVLGFITDYKLCLSMLFASITILFSIGMIMPKDIDLKENFNFFDNLDEGCQVLGAILLALFVSFMYLTILYYKMIMI